MPAFSYAVVTTLSRGRVWSLLTDITNWPKFSDIYSDLRWEGTPWAEGSAIVGRLNYPIVLDGRYAIRECTAPALIRYLSQTRDAGFATERTITLEQLGSGTLIHADAYVVGRPDMPGGASEFLKNLTTRWFNEFARFCDNENLFSADYQWAKDDASWWEEHFRSSNPPPAAGDCDIKKARVR